MGGEVQGHVGQSGGCGMLGVAGQVPCDTGLSLILKLFYRWRILSRKARNKV